MAKVRYHPEGVRPNNTADAELHNLRRIARNSGLWSAFVLVLAILPFWMVCKLWYAAVPISWICWLANAKVSPAPALRSAPSPLMSWYR